MVDKLNLNYSGNQINAEPISVPSASPYTARTLHNRLITGSVEIWQNNDKTGTQLTEEPYTGTVSESGKFQVDYTGAQDGDVQYRNTILFHSAQAGTNWFIWYKSIGDIIDANDFNAKVDKVVGGTENDLVVLDSIGKIKDSGKKISDFEPVIPTKGTAFNKDFGTAADTVCEGNDSRLSDTRTPKAHASTHVTGGTDIIPNAVAGGNSGLMSGADKQKLDNAATKNYVDTQDLGKVDKIIGGTPGNLASLNATGNLQDSGKSVANFVNIISSDLTLNVPSEYATIQDALNYLSDKFIPDNVTVTIRVAAGIHTHTSQITVKHPCGKQIQIVGADPITTTISSVGTVSGSAGNWSVPITVADATGIQVGQYAIVRNTTGTDDHYALRGIWEITDVSGNTITIKNTHRKDTFPTFTCTGGDVVVLTTILKFNDCHGITVDGAILGYLNNVAVVSNGASGYSGIIALGNYSIRGAIRCGDNVGVNGFGSYGYYAAYSGSINAGYSIASGNGSHGYYATHPSSIYAGYSIASGNRSYGYCAAHSGSIYAGYSIASGNGTDYNAIRMGYIYCYGYVGSPTFSPALNTEGNYNAIITT